MIKVLKAEMKHDDELKRIAKQHKHTRDFCSIMFIRQGIDRLYADGGVGRAMEGRKVVGFVCAKHLIRKPFTSIYYMGTDPEHLGKGVGRALINWTLRTSPHGRIQLICEDINTQALAFYRACGFKCVERGATKSGKAYQRLELK